MNRSEDAIANSPASLPRIWGNSALLALLISLVETALRLQSPVFECSSADFSQLALLFVCGSIFWMLLQLPVVFLVFFRKKARKRLPGFLLSITAGLYLYVLFLVIVASWYFYVTRGIFLTYGLLKFAFANSASLPLHFMQTGMSFFLLLNGISAILATSVLAVLSAEFSWSAKVSRAITILTLVEMTVALACILTFSRSSLWGNTHPFPAYRYQPEATQSPGIRISKLKSELKPKTDAIAYNPAMLQTTHPVFVIMVESMPDSLHEISY